MGLELSFHLAVLFHSFSLEDSPSFPSRFLISQLLPSHLSLLSSFLSLPFISHLPSSDLFLLPIVSLLLRLFHSFLLQIFSSPLIFFSSLSVLLGASMGCYSFSLKTFSSSLDFLLFSFRTFLLQTFSSPLHSFPPSVSSCAARWAVNGVIFIALPHTLLAFYAAQGHSFSLNVQLFFITGAVIARIISRPGGVDFIFHYGVLIV